MKQQDDEEEAPEEEEQQDEDEGASSSKRKKPVDPGKYTLISAVTNNFNNNNYTEKEFKQLSDVKKFDYLLGMSMWMLTEEKKNELLKQRDNKIAELDQLKRKTPQDLWRDDLDAFVTKLDEVEEKERKDEQGVKKEKKETVR